MSRCDYIIDAEDTIVSISDNWLSLALENEALHSCHPDRVLNKPIWTFIVGPETAHVYEIILDRVRSANRSVSLPFRCDAPDRRRHLELCIAPAQEGRIEFYRRMIYEELRECQPLLHISTPRTSELIRMCSMCKKVALSENTWVEVEIAVVAMGLFEATSMPRISHGFCSACYRQALAEVERLK